MLHNPSILLFHSKCRKNKKEIYTPARCWCWWCFCCRRFIRRPLFRHGGSGSCNIFLATKRFLKDKSRRKSFKKRMKMQMDGQRANVTPRRADTLTVVPLCKWCVGTAVPAAVMLPARVSDGTTTKLLRTCLMRMIQFSRAVAEKERKDALLILSRPSRINKLSAYERYVYRCPI